ncbi:hypothetical protein, partial [Paraburkholderia sp. SIMBA_053]|uniref:hypothetical protein n=1 Tax=Paraburkholderia sp. SIMBA_053 TaxID=3085794 RepID=UPI00397B579E
VVSLQPGGFDGLFLLNIALAKENANTASFHGVTANFWRYAVYTTRANGASTGLLRAGLSFFSLWELSPTGGGLLLLEPP